MKTFLTQFTCPDSGIRFAGNNVVAPSWDVAEMVVAPPIEIVGELVSEEKDVIREYFARDADLE